MDSSRILIIDDEDAIRFGISELLKSHGFTVFTAEDGKEGLRQAQEQKPDLILCDVMMPGMSGYEVLQEARKDRTLSTIPFIFLTARSRKEEVRFGMNLGADDYLTKPCAPTELLNTVKTRLQRSAAFQQWHQQEIRQAEEKLEYLMHHDSLTGLPNRLLLRDLFQEISAKGSLTALFSLSVDNYERIDERLGYAFSEVILKLIAERLERWSDGKYPIAHLSGAHFVLLLSTSGGEESVSTVARDLLQTVSRPVLLEHHEVFLTSTVGIAFYPRDATDFDMLLKNSNTAMRSLQQEGGNGFRFYNKALEVRTAQDLFVESQLPHAIEKQQLHIYYQPRLSLRTHSIVGAEALLRWNHPESGFISPSEFIPHAESSGLINTIGQWVLRQVCIQIGSWKDFLPPAFKMGVNVSGVQFNDDLFVQTVETILQETAVHPGRLELEITESSVVKGPARALTALETLKKMELTVAIDDFGTGYSSLSYLKQFPIDTLKIDQTFVRDVLEPKTAEIVKGMIQMAHGMGLQVVAEGVETIEQLLFLRMNQCDEIQGFYFSPAVPASELETMIRENRKLRFV